MNADQLLIVKARCISLIEECNNTAPNNALSQQLLATWTTNLLLVELLLEKRIPK